MWKMQVHYVLERLLPLYERHAFFEDNQQQILASQSSSVVFVHQIRNFLEKFFEANQECAEIVNELFIEMPKFTDQLVFTDQGEGFQDSEELEILSSVSSIGVLSIIINIIIAVVVICLRILRHRGLRLEASWCCCIRKVPDVIEPMRASMPEEIPLRSEIQEINQPLQAFSWPAIAEAPSWRN